MKKTFLYLAGENDGQGPTPQGEFDELLKLSGIQNKLKTKNWIVHTAKVLESKHQLLVLRVDIASAQKLNGSNHGRHLRTGEVVFKMISKN